MALVTPTLIIWLGAEAWLIAWQFRQSGHAKTTEWATLGVILLSLWVGTALAAVTDSAVPQADIPVPLAVTFDVGLLVAWAGIVFRLVSIHILGRYFRYVVHVQEGHQVVRSGPYRVIRHPAYAGLLVAMIGFGLTHHNFASFVVLVGCSLVGVLYRIRVEERVLRAELGSVYADYASRTARLIPGVW
jgi:protein-S-isoprenylcysteine O-methyltransferase Ste14